MSTSSNLRLWWGRITLALFATTTLGSAQTVTFPDARLEAAVREALTWPPGDITQAEMLTLTNLPADGRGIEDTRGLETALNLQTLSLNGNPVTNYSGIIGLTNLFKLDFIDAGISDLAFLSDLTKLQTLTIYNNLIQDISPLAGLRELQTLQLDWNVVTNLTPLSGLTNLVNLSLAGNNVANIDFIAPLLHLQSLGLYINQVKDLSPLLGRTNLLALGLGWNGVTNPAVIATLTGLQNLALNGNLLTNVPFLAGLTNLTSLGLDYTALEDMSPVTNLTKLNDLNVGENSLTSVPDLSSLTNLTVLMIAGNQLTDLWPLTNLAVVDQLHLQRNLFEDLSPLTHLPSLHVLLLSGNTVTNLSALQALTNLWNLELEAMHLSNLAFLTPLTQLSRLDLSDNQLTGFSGLTNFPWLNWLGLDQNRLQEIGPLLDCPSLNYVNVKANVLDTNATSAAWHVVTNLQARGVSVEFDPQYPLSVLPAIILPPRNQSAFTNTTTTFNVLATSTAPTLYYRWQMNGLDLANAGPISGADTDTLQISGLTAADAGLYQVRVWTDFGTTNSLAAELRVVTNVFFADPRLDQAVRDAVQIPDGPLTPASVVGLYSLDASNYGITNLAGLEALANLVGLSLSGNPAIASFQPLRYLAALNALDVGYCGLDSLDWLSSLPTLNEVRFDGNFIDDLSPLRALGSLVNVFAVGNQLTAIDPLLDLSALVSVDVSLNRLNTNDASAAWAVITNLQARSVTVEYDPQCDAPVRPEILSPPLDAAAYLDAPVSFNVVASGAGSGLSYQWQKNRVNLLNDSHISGAQESTLQINNATASDGGAYRVRIWDELGVTNSRSATLRVITSVTFVDPHLEQAVRDNLGLPPGPITLDDIKALTSLDAPGYGITNLAGLEAAANLTWLTLNDNPGITDFTRLADLPNLNVVYLDNCIVSDLSFVAALPSLWEFAAPGGEQVTDLSPLAACGTLRVLNLGDNPGLTNLAVLNTLTNLEGLSLNSTSLSNISFVAFMPGLLYLNIRGNAVQDLSPLTNSRQRNPRPPG